MTRRGLWTVWLALALTLALGLATTGCKSDAQQRDEHLAAAEAYSATGRFTEALIELRNALKIDPQNADISFRIAEVMRYQDRLEDAAFFYREAFRLDPTRTDAAVEEAAILIFDDPARAVELLDGVQEREPDNVLAYVVRSRLGLVSNNVDEGLRFALTAVQLDPNSAAAHSQLGKVYQAMIRQATLEKKVAPDDVFASAIKSFGRVRELSGDVPFHASEAMALQAQVYGAWEGHEKEAAAAWRQALELARPVAIDAPVRNFQTMAERYGYASKDLELSRFALGERVVRDPDDGRAWERLAALEGQLGGDPDAVFQRMLDATPESSAAYVRFAQFLEGAGREPEATALLDDALARGIDPPILLAALAQMHRRAGDEAQAVRYEERLQKEFPKHYRAAMARAYAALRDGDLEGARSELLALVDREERSEALLLLARVEKLRDHPQDALDAIDRAIEAAPPGWAPVSAIRLRAKLETEVRDCASALRSWTLVTKRNQTLSPRERVLQARCLYIGGRPDLGRKVLEKVIAESGSPTAAVIEYAAREGERRPEQVGKLLAEAYAKHPTEGGILIALTRHDSDQGRDAEALRRLNEAFEAGTVTPPLVLERARLFAKRGQLAEAERDALQAFHANPGLVEASALLLGIYNAQGRLGDAISSFEEAATAGALGATGKALLAQLHMREGNSARAVALLDEALAERSDLPGAKNDLAYLLAQKGTDLDRALTLAQEAQQALTESPAVAHTLGYVYLKRGLYEPAVQQLRYALSIATEQDRVQPIYHLHLGEALDELGRGSDAQSEYEKVLEMDESNSEAAARLEALRGRGESAVNPS